MRLYQIALAMLVSTAAVACSEIPTGDSLEQARSAIANRNFGDAATIARQLATKDPQDPDAHFELARAEALLGNEGASLSALQTAIELGLGNAATSLNDPAFDELRGGEQFAALELRAFPSAVAASPAGRGGFETPVDFEPSSRIGAGQGSDRVEILESDSRTVIRAGDIVLDTDF